MIVVGSRMLTLYGSRLKIESVGVQKERERREREKSSRSEPREIIYPW